MRSREEAIAELDRIHELYSSPKQNEIVARVERFVHELAEIIYQTTKNPLQKTYVTQEEYNEVVAYIQELENKKRLRDRNYFDISFGGKYEPCYGIETPWGFVRLEVEGKRQ
ncbi:hypothetical protein BH780_gp094 [Bacillus phage Eldridge]|uniref:Uncharacterized protein n=1 Tax=Bacillus phage Eldridge TaxID=1776293 RepID=A0A0Y0ASB5_9CAUD|nr:hypothetical protein BH780_gp094 [Bacillus phage Eldridge]AMB18677.1 hypothetical protein Eldridge_097 [Bacillus phage Eldridge]